MLYQLVTNTAGLVQTNLTMIRDSYPVAVITDKFRDMVGWKSGGTDAVDEEDNFDDTPTPKPSDYITIYDMVARTINGEKMPITRWIWFWIGLVLTSIVIFMVTNHMIMLPWSIRLFAALYIANIATFADFTGLNMIYYILMAYGGIFLYRYYLQTTDPTLNIVPFYTFGFLPLRTAKLNWTDTINNVWLYLHGGAVGSDYNALVRTTEDYIEAQKAAFPDYSTLEGTFNLKPLYEAFENHVINMNLPGFMPPPPDTSIQDAQKVIELATGVQTVSNASHVINQAKDVQDVSKAQEVQGIVKAVNIVQRSKTALNKSQSSPQSQSVPK